MAVQITVEKNRIFKSFFISQNNFKACIESRVETTVTKKDSIENIIIFALFTNI